MNSVNKILVLLVPQLRFYRRLGSDLVAFVKIARRCQTDIAPSLCLPQVDPKAFRPHLIQQLLQQYELAEDGQKLGVHL